VFKLYKLPLGKYVKYSLGKNSVVHHTPLINLPDGGQLLISSCLPVRKKSF